MSGETAPASPTNANQTVDRFPCPGCGAPQGYEPGTNHLRCPYCEARESIPPSTAPINEIDYASHVSEISGKASTTEVVTVQCKGCGALLKLPAQVTAQACAFCASPLVLEHANCQQLIAPQALLPFQITAAKAQQAFQEWLGGRWFAPNALKRAARQDGLQGVYIPYWTYDCDTETRYRGQRGENRQESYQDSQGKTQTRTVIDWYPASGTVNHAFDDVLVVASKSLPDDYVNDLEPWDLEKLLPYQPQYISGFVAEAYQITLGDAYVRAQERMQGPITAAVERDIGGDHQRIEEMQTQYANTTFKHVLLPIWISAYRFEGKVFRFLVNARSGEVQGERPWSIWKITGAVLLALLVVLLWLYTSN